jgi:hypothetical protein
MQTKPTPTEGQNSDKHTAESALRDAACCASFIMEVSVTITDDRASTSDEVPMHDRIDEMVDVWNLGSRSMGIGLRQVDRRGHQRHRNDTLSKSGILDRSTGS